jgi:hypothetical protein
VSNWAMQLLHELKKLQKCCQGCSAHPGYGAAATAPMIAGRTSTAGSPAAQRSATSRSASHLLRQ